LPGTLFSLESIADRAPFILVIDIILTLFLFYQIFKLLRGSKAIPLLNGLGFIFILSLISEWLRFFIFAGLLKYILGILLIAIPVLFQPELRRALEQLGKQNILTRYLKLNNVPPFQTIQAIASAAGQMAAVRLGGLIVLEREAVLDEIIGTGTRIDALVSPIFLRQIFATNTPLHDGAIIVRGSRVIAAGCLLPLSVNRKLPLEWGTRHRAGIGITEISDAAVIIISEERGTITLAYDGRSISIANGEDLLRELKEITTAEASPAKTKEEAHA
jgi:diadenylate cyclase